MFDTLAQVQANRCHDWANPPPGARWTTTASPRRTARGSRQRHAMATPRPGCPLVARTAARGVGRTDDVTNATTFAPDPAEWSAPGDVGGQMVGVNARPPPDPIAIHELRRPRSQMAPDELSGPDRPGARLAYARQRHRPGARRTRI